ncbi:MAG: glycosyltransferase family 2 protein, partial [bacterium]|nr:glycosyltransferase family 2 protein [bacterium]
DDTVVSPDFLDILVATGENNPDVGMLGPKIYYFDEPKRIWFAGAKFDEQTGLIFASHSDEIGNNRKDEKPEESDYVTGCALLVKKRLIDIIGILDERFFLYWEDVDWGLRAKKAGFKNLTVPSAHIWHKVSVSTGGMESPLRAYHKTRSHLVMAKLHAPWALNRLHWRFFRDIAWLLFRSSDREKIKKVRAYFAAIIDYHLGKTGRGPHWLWANN